MAWWCDERSLLTDTYHLFIYFTFQVNLTFGSINGHWNHTSSKLFKTLRLENANPGEQVNQCGSARLQLLYWQREAEDPGHCSLPLEQHRRFDFKGTGEGGRGGLNECSWVVQRNWYSCTMICFGITKKEKGRSKYCCLHKLILPGAWHSSHWSSRLTRFQFLLPLVLTLNQQSIFTHYYSALAVLWVCGGGHHPQVWFALLRPGPWRTANYSYSQPALSVFGAAMYHTLYLYPYYPNLQEPRHYCLST